MLVINVILILILNNYLYYDLSFNLVWYLTFKFLLEVSLFNFVCKYHANVLRNFNIKIKHVIYLFIYLMLVFFKFRSPNYFFEYI